MTAAPSRRSGLLVPLFAASSSRSWGIGDIGDIAPLAAWLGAAGQRILQLLPLNEMAAGSHSPYSAMTAMAIDPIFLCVPDVPEFAAMGGESSLDADDRRRLAHARHSAHVDYAAVRAVKGRALARAFDWFMDREWRRQTPRAVELQAYAAAQSWWLDDYALFRAVHATESGRAWTAWPDGLRRRTADALDAARQALERDILFRQYLQWLAAGQWHRARLTAAARGVAMFGDLPFMVDMDSADVWARQACFDLDRSVGVPPDAFSATGQDWGMPSYNWQAMASDDFGWLRDRARRSAELYDGFRVDHLVG